MISVGWLLSIFHRNSKIKITLSIYGAVSVGCCFFFAPVKKKRKKALRSETRQDTKTGQIGFFNWQIQFYLGVNSQSLWILLIGYQTVNSIPDPRRRNPSLIQTRNLSIP